MRKRSLKVLQTALYVGEAAFCAGASVRWLLFVTWFRPSARMPRIIVKAEVALTSDLIIVSSLFFRHVSELPVS